MVDALLFLQDHKADLQNIGETLTQDEGLRRHATKEVMLATCFCVFFEYVPVTESSDASRVLAAFSGALSRPDEFLQDLLTLRAQAVPKAKIFRLQPLVHEADINGTDSRGVLDSLSAFARAALESAQIYSEIRDAVDAGQLDRQQAANVLDSLESDQRPGWPSESSIWLSLIAFSAQEDDECHGHCAGGDLPVIMASLSLAEAERGSAIGVNGGGMR
ncbi:unnamed protein product [Effrenium voratum]|uniref:Uncharacterized protein n=1 Tax=Effrenium voratum TaxID=2562239 RepID=A0AA36I396_9DINO|nr:unnamed protein product [Effrenium voratum]